MFYQAALTPSGIGHMGWVKDALFNLDAGEPAIVRPQGGAMRGRIEGGQEVTISPCDPDAVQVDDVVFIKGKGNFILHIVQEIREDALLIGNSLSKINGWTPRVGRDGLC